MAVQATFCRGWCRPPLPGHVLSLTLAAHQALGFLLSPALAGRRSKARSTPGAHTSTSLWPRGTSAHSAAFLGAPRLGCVVGAAQCIGRDVTADPQTVQGCGCWASGRAGANGPGHSDPGLLRQPSIGAGKGMLGHLRLQLPLLPESWLRPTRRGIKTGPFHRGTNPHVSSREALSSKSCPFGPWSCWPLCSERCPRLSPTVYL